MLNVGVLGHGASNYYAGVVATSAEDSYTGKGESPGRWVGSLAIEIGFVGTVDLDDFRAVLAGRDPRTNEYLISAQGNAARAAPQRQRRVSTAALDEEVDVLRAAAHLGVSGQYVRFLLKEGDEYRTRLGETAAADANDAPSAHLCGRKVPRTAMPDEGWVVSRVELEPFSESRQRRPTRPPRQPDHPVGLRRTRHVVTRWRTTGLVHSRAFDARARWGVADSGGHGVRRSRVPGQAPSVAMLAHHHGRSPSTRLAIERHHLGAPGG